MGHGHSHHHHHHSSAKNLLIVFLLNLGFTIFEIIGGIYINSVAVISDAIHDLGDSVSLGLAWYLDKKSKKGSTKTYTFGYARFSLLGALINSIVLIVGSFFVIWQAIERFIYPAMPNENGMLLFAAIGIVVNGYAAWKLSGGKSINEKVIKWHLLEDVLGWVAILVAAVVMKFYPSPYIDPALSLVITLYILYNVYKRLKETLELFLQRVPHEVNVKEMEGYILEIEEIHSVHHSHLWSLDGERHVFSIHIKLKRIENLNDLLHIKKQVKKILKKYHLEHQTIELELENEKCEHHE